MSQLLVVDDDPNQLEVRKLLLEEAGYKVRCAGSAREAMQACADCAPQTLVMDLRLPRAEDGLELIREVRGSVPGARIVVLSGWIADLTSRPEAALVDHILAKPVRSRKLLQLLAQIVVLWLCMAPLLGAQGYPFQLDAPAEVVAEIDMSSPGTDWGRVGREAAMAVVTVDDAKKQHVMLFGGELRRRYSVFLGPLEPGGHTVKVERHPDYSARATTLQVNAVTYRQFKAGDPEYAMIANAPALYARPNTVGKFTDIPLITYCEKLADGSLRYSVIFSNEDGGTSTRALMARWGRATDIEHVYQVWPDTSGKPGRTLIQTRDHKDVPFRGKYEGQHPVLGVVTDNNMVDDSGTSAVRYQLTPIAASIPNASREQVMDENPITYVISARELEREGKLRKFGTVEGSKISQPENYLFAEFRVFAKETRVAFWIRLEGENFWRSSDLGNPDMAIERNGWVRTAIELPPATQPTQIAEIGFQCLPEKNSSGSVACRVEMLSKLFFLEANHQPGRNIWQPRMDRGPWVIQPGNLRTITLR